MFCQVFRDDNKTRELSYIGKQNKMKSNVKQLFAYQDCEDTSNALNKRYFPYGNTEKNSIFVKQFGLLSTENFKKYFFTMVLYSI